MLAWETGNEMAWAHHSLPALPSAQRLTPEGMISQLRLSGGNFRVLLKFAGMFPVRPVQCVVLFSLWGNPHSIWTYFSGWYPSNLSVLMQRTHQREVCAQRA